MEHAETALDGFSASTAQASSGEELFDVALKLGSDLLSGRAVRVAHVRTLEGNVSAADASKCTAAQLAAMGEAVVVVVPSEPGAPQLWEQRAEALVAAAAEKMAAAAETIAAAVKADREADRVRLEALEADREADRLRMEAMEAVAVKATADREADRLKAAEAAKAIAADREADRLKMKAMAVDREADRLKAAEAAKAMAADREADRLDVKKYTMWPLQKRSLLDMGRGKTNELVLLAESGESGSKNIDMRKWDARLKKWAADESIPGLTREDVLELLLYKDNKLQGDGNSVAHTFSPESVAEAVLAEEDPDTRRKLVALFEFVLGNEPQELVFGGRPTSAAERGSGGDGGGSSAPS